MSRMEALRPKFEKMPTRRCRISHVRVPFHVGGRRIYARTHDVGLDLCEPFRKEYLEQVRAADLGILERLIGEDLVNAAREAEEVHTRAPKGRIGSFNFFAGERQGRRIVLIEFQR